MDEEFYVVVISGHLQSRRFRTLETAKKYIGEYGRGKVCRVYKYSFSGEMFKTEPEPLYKKLW